jgi:hypothetical protein
MNIVYLSATRACTESDGVVAHAEGRPAPWVEARAPGTGGPRSGECVGRIDGETWTIPPASDAVRILMTETAALIS